jgi:hypothetical protein
MGRVVWAAMPLGWWKAMELTFGAALGLSYVLCAWTLRHQLAGVSTTVASRSALPRAFLEAAIAIVLAIVSGLYLPVRFDYTIAGAMLASLLLFSETLAWQTAITATCTAFAWDFLEYQTFAPLPLAWTVVVVTAIVITIAVARYPRTLAMLLLVTWAAVASAFRFLLPPSRVGPESLTLLAVFVGLAVVMSLMVLGRQQPTRD